MIDIKELKIGDKLTCVKDFSYWGCESCKEYEVLALDQYKFVFKNDSGSIRVDTHLEDFEKVRKPVVGDWIKYIRQFNYNDFTNGKHYEILGFDEDNDPITIDDKGDKDAEFMSFFEFDAKESDRLRKPHPVIGTIRISGEAYDNIAKAFGITTQPERKQYRFSEALDLLNDGKTMTRTAWGSNIQVSVVEPKEGSELTVPYLMMCKVNEDICFPLDLSCESILAEDWVLVR